LKRGERHRGGERPSGKAPRCSSSSTSARAVQSCGRQCAQRAVRLRQWRGANTDAERAVDRARQHRLSDGTLRLVARATLQGEQPPGDGGGGPAAESASRLTALSLSPPLYTIAAQCKRCREAGPREARGADLRLGPPPCISGSRHGVDVWWLPNSRRLAACQHRCPT
jgi:hypothetical protein